MLECGELKQVFRGMTGTWEKDSRRFIQEQQDLEQIVGITNIDEIDDND